MKLSDLRAVENPTVWQRAYLRAFQIQEEFGVTAVVCQDNTDIIDFIFGCYKVIADSDLDCRTFFQLETGHTLYEHGRGMHPIKQMEVARNIRKAIFGTHSPFVLDQLKAEQVLVLYGQKFATLSQHPKYPECKDILTTGQLWTLEGEDRVK